MINSNNLKKEFLNYISNYDIQNPKIALKIGHIQRVAKTCKKIAKSLNLSEEEIRLAEAIGYFHDIGRFEQVRLTNSFNDRLSHINHAQKSIDVLFENNLIRKFIKESTYDEIIKKAVLNHNKAQIDPDINEKEMLFSKIIRDADKIDILNTITFDSFPAIFWFEDFDSEKINDQIIQDFKDEKYTNYSIIKNNADMIMGFYGYIYDLNFNFSLQYICKKKYLDKFKERIIENFSSATVHNQIEEIHKIYKEYIKKSV